MSKKLLRKMYSLILVFIMISGLIPGLKTGAVKVFAGNLPDGTINPIVFDNVSSQNATGYDNVKNSTDFNISFDGGNVGGQQGYLSYVNPDGVFISDALAGTDTNTHSIRIDANQSTVSSFKLNNITLQFVNLSDTFNVTITGFLAAGGTITYNAGNIVGPSPFPILVSSNANFLNNNITGFQISYSTSNGSPIGDFALSQFSISNAQAPAAAPSATTGTATGISSTGATLNGTVNANNADTTVTFEYGTDTGYGSSATASPSTATGNGISVSAAITGLSSGTTYHYRVVATNSQGTITGTDQSFTTPVAPPVLTASSGSSSFIEGSPVAVDNGITLTSGSNISSATVSITGNFKSSEDLLIFTNTSSVTFGNIANSYNSSTGVLTLSSSGATATLAQWQAALRAVTYNNYSDSPNTGTRTVSFVATDGNGNSSTAVTKTVTITGVNDPPTLNTTSLNPPFTAGGSAAALFNNTSISTEESGQLISSISLTVTGLINGSNELLGIDGTNAPLINDANGTTAANGFNYSVALTGNTAAVNITKTSGFTVSDAQNLIDGLTYSNSVNATAGPRTITLTSIQDNGGTSNGGTDTTNLSNASVVTVIQVPPVTPIVPGAPSGVFASAGDGEATVSFLPSVFDGGSPIASYTVTANPGGITATGSSSPITVTGLTNGTAYTFTVTATNDMAITGTPSSPSIPVTPKAAQTITFNNPGDQAFGTSPTLTATATSSLAVTFTSSNPDVATITPGGVLTFIKVGDVTINAYQVGNAAFNPAPMVSQTFHVNAVAPGAPTAVTATAGNGKATVNFTAPAFKGGSAITGYTVTANPGGKTATGSSSPITVTGLTNGTTYTFTVTATNSIGTGAASLPSSNTVITPPPPAPSSGGGSSAGGTVQVPVTAGNTTAVQLPVAISANADGSVTGYAQLDGNSAASITQGAVSANSGSATVGFPSSLLGSSYTVGIGVPPAVASQFSGSNIGLRISTPDAEVALTPGVLGSLTGSSGSIYISNRLGAASQQIPQLIGRYAPGAQRLTSGINITGNLYQPVTITLPFNIIRTSAAGEANTASDNLAVLAQYSDGTNSVERGTVTYDANGNPTGISIVADKLGTFTVIKLPSSSTEGNKTVIPYKVNADKAWQLGFSENIDASTVSKDSVYVTDESGNKADVKLTVSDSVLTITPVNNYTSGKTYTLYIDSKVSGKDGNSIGKALEYEFTIVQ